MQPVTELSRRLLGRATHRLRSVPVIVLMPHSACNCRCVMCDIWKANATKTEISTADLERHLEDLRRLRVRHVALSGGEALMHSNLWALCRLLREEKIRITLLSTGLLLARNAAAVTRWCDEVIVSLDGDRRIHDRIRNVPRAFDQLAEGVAALRDAATGFRVTARCVVQRENFDKLPPIVEAAHQLQLDSLSFLAADVSTEAFNRPEGWSAERTSEVALSLAQARSFEQVVERLVDDNRADFESGFIVESAEKMQSIARYFLALNGEGEPSPVRCNAPWVSTVVEADGTVRPCFFHRAFGNIHEQPLFEILNSPKAIEFRRGLDVRRDPVCRKCVCTLRLSPWASVQGAS